MTRKVDRVETSSGNQGSSIQAGLGGRYASALFDLAVEARAVDRVEQSLSAVRDALAASSDFATLTASPVIARGEAVKAVLATADELGLDATTRSFLGVLAENRRLGELPQIIRAFRTLAARHRGETTAEVTSAHPLTPEQVDELKQQLRRRVGREVSVDLSVDPQILGGLVVRIGSQMIDSSIRTRLNALASAMKG
ncbi:ATP synthase subunit delta [Sphingomonas endophytica]|uniref:ATP synthase subunit delta n=1 Tax=Sphingomonas endophytica TaxID=869719 RepID=A0A147HX85_9SPHN|nr:F0F1 ATP synthase subunit delta [Sphingomonas endophytica]KTT69563.1 ATP synthase subunit delta [Sphingomonas endophytica]